jgi:hypothetical protein
MLQTPNLSLPYIDLNEAQREVVHNNAIRGLDALVQLAVLDRDLASPPGSPADGQRWIVAASPTGAWAGHASQVAAWQDGAWRFYVPSVGWLAYVVDDGTLLGWSGSAWASARRRTRPTRSAPSSIIRYGRPKPSRKVATATCATR